MAHSHVGQTFVPLGWKGGGGYRNANLRVRTIVIACSLRLVSSYLTVKWCVLVSVRVDVLLDPNV